MSKAQVRWPQGLHCLYEVVQPSVYWSMVLRNTEKSINDHIDTSQLAYPALCVKHRSGDLKTTVACTLYVYSTNVGLGELFTKSQHKTLYHTVHDCTSDNRHPKDIGHRSFICMMKHIFNII